MTANFTPAEDILGHPLPHRRMEAWKYTDVRKAVTETARGLTLSGEPTMTTEGSLALNLRGEKDMGDSPMSELADSFDVPIYGFTVKQAVAEKPVRIAMPAQGHTRIQIKLASRASVHVIEDHRGASGAFSNVDIVFLLGKGAHLTRTVLVDDPDDHVRVCTATIDMETDAKLTQHTLSFGGALSRQETQIAGYGRNVNCLINGAYLLSGNRHCDFTSHIALGHPGAHIRQSVKGVTQDKSRGVFQGKFYVDRKAQHTDAEMRHDALMLSDRSEIRSKPELEIYADDVACAHGNTIGQLDESALFYMRQRGIPVKAARALLTQAFLADVFDDMDDEALQADILGKITAWLEA